jgi:hypothetical protein
LGVRARPRSLRRWANGTARSAGGRRRRRSPSSTPPPRGDAPTAAKSERAAKKGIRLRGPSRNEVCVACGAGRARRFAAVEGAKGLPDKDNPMEPINKAHRSPERFLRARPDIERRRLRDWLSLFRFIWNEQGSPEGKAKSLIIRMVSRRRIIRFRKEKTQSSDRGPYSTTRVQSRLLTQQIARRFPRASYH